MRPSDQSAGGGNVPSTRGTSQSITFAQEHVVRRIWHAAVTAVPGAELGDLSILRSPAPLELQCEVSLANIVVGLQFLDRRAIDDLALVDDGGVAGEEIGRASCRERVYD